MNDRKGIALGRIRSGAANMRAVPASAAADEELRASIEAGGGRPISAPVVHHTGEGGSTR